MSDIFRKSVLNRLPQLPPTRAPWAEPAEGDGEGEEELEDGDIMDLASGPNSMASSLKSMSSGSSSKRTLEDYTPLSASGYFDQALEVNPPGSDTTFRAYMTPPRMDKGKGKETYLVCHHGGGASGLSFAALAKAVKESSNGELGVLAFDCRGHGKTRSDGGGDRDTDLSLSTLLSDLVGLLEHVFPDPKTGPSLLLLGHSLGAAPILASSPTLQQKGYTVPGVVVLDVVEGTAVAALPSMKSILSGRPPSFKSVEDAIRWHVSSNSIRNIESARISVPSYIRPPPNSTSPTPQSRQIWRTDLVATEPYWDEWYAGLSNKFLGSRCARMLVLAGQERLDRDLMVGQMQGKFQLEVMKNVGHYLHEDDPETLASLLVTFWRRNTQVVVLPPKIGSTATGVEVKRVGEL